jgi:hypothetical protein
MKQLMMAFAVMAALVSGTMAADGAEGAAKEKPKHAQMTKEQREEMIAKKLEAIKAKDEAKYKELVELKEKDPKAFAAKMREMAKEDHAKGGKGKGKKAGGAAQ